MANPGLIDGIWGGSVPYHYNGLKSNMQWLELVAGVNVQIYKASIWDGPYALNLNSGLDQRTWKSMVCTGFW